MHTTHKQQIRNAKRQRETDSQSERDTENKREKRDSIKKRKEVPQHKTKSADTKKCPEVRRAHMSYMCLALGGFLPCSLALAFRHFQKMARSFCWSTSAHLSTGWGHCQGRTQTRVPDCVAARKLDLRSEPATAGEVSPCKQRKCPNHCPTGWTPCLRKRLSTSRYNTKTFRKRRNK